MAQKLKASSHAFADSLDSEKDIIGRAVEGLDNNETGMNAAQRTMKTLTRMTEGKSWWDRMFLFAYIAALWFLAFFIVFFMPKLRF